MGTDYKLEFKEKIHISDSLEIQKTHEFYKKNKTLFLIVLILSFGTPILGYFVTGIYGVIFGLVIGALTYFLSPYAVIKIREITKYQAK